MTNLLRLPVIVLLLCVGISACSRKVPTAETSTPSASEELAPSIAGVKIGGAVPSSQQLGEPEAREQTGPFTIRRWKLATTNELSVTVDTSTGKVVFVELDFDGRSSLVDAAGRLRFGSTSLAELRQLFSSNGFIYAGAPFGKVAGSLVVANSYAVDRADGTVATFITKITRKDFADVKAGRKAIGTVAMLDSVILAEPSYLAQIWGRSSSPDPTYRPVSWPGDALR